MSRDTRILIVACLTGHGMTLPEIASELGVSKETVRRDLQNAPAPEPPPVAADAVPDNALVLPLDEPLSEALRVLRSVHNGPDTAAQNVAAVRAAVRATADAVIDARTPHPART
ncbi:sigma factor-like helix-turn-helix DNA-binding protein [Streptomyces spinosisporus]|uniref:DeoR family transcriptional regulator n=1 Tax=Streptomyces spinosisporus TaxID=2927582 RepID=A0ABS9XDW1_9ACTN|nr:sigma factor-like helix-turn-helix DNA-binding protein [Streptomyces spinosisporus]MCI3240272.1 DeoR family transcriptional regulator [Streptomyces spinosisporus]